MRLIWMCLTIELNIVKIVLGKTSNDFEADGIKHKKLIIKKIEDILGDINQTAEVGENPKLIIRNQRLWSNCIYDLDRYEIG